MTCIVGLCYNNTVYMGADSAGVSDNGDLVIQATPKIFKVADMLIGVSGSMRWGQVIRHYLAGSFERYQKAPYIIEVASALAALADAHKATLGSNPLQVDATTLIGWQGKLYVITSDFAVIESVHPYAAIGSGKNIALGAMMALDTIAAGDPSSGWDWLRISLRAAEAFESSVRGPFVFEELEA